MFSLGYCPNIFLVLEGFHSAEITLPWCNSNQSMQGLVDNEFCFQIFFYFSILCISVMYYNTSKEYKGSYSGRLESSQDQFKQINVTLCQHSQVNLSGHAILSISLRCLDIRDTFLTHCCDLSVILSHFSREDTLQTVRCQTGQRSSVSKTSHAIS